MSQRQVAFSPHELIFDKKFDVALRLSHASTVYTKLVNSACDIDENILIKACKYAKIPTRFDSWQVNYHVFPEIYLKCLKLPIASRNNPEMMKIVNIMSLVAECQLAWNNDNLKSSLKVDVRHYAETVKNRVHESTTIHKLLAAKKVFDTVTKTMPVADGPRRRDEQPDDYIKRVASKSHLECGQLGIRIAWSRRSCVIHTPTATYLLPRSYLLLIHNKIMDILSVLVYAACTPHQIYDHDLLATTERFLKEWLFLAERLQQKFFTLSKVWEGICIGESLFRVEGEGNRQFLRTIADVVREDTHFEYEGSELCRICRFVPLAVVHELSCLSKVAGHPFVDVELSAETLMEKVNEQKNINLAKIERAKLFATEDFIRQFRKAEGRWPPISWLPGASPALMKAQELNADPRSLTHQKLHGAISIQDYAFVTIEKCLEFDWVENFLPFVKDRTVSFVRNEVEAVYIPESASYDPEFRPNWSKTRALLLYLLWPNKETDHQEYMKHFVAGNWELVMNYLVIRLVPKEREHKIAARTFGAKTPQDRARSIIQELNVARFLDKYSDEHVMTQGEIDVAKKLLGFRMLKFAHPGFSMIILQIDASSWNSRFRHESVAPIVQHVLDCAFNVEIFSKTHEAFEMSFVYMPDGAKTYSWDGQLGGVEGLQQYTWVFTYIHHIKVCMEEHPYPFYILCKGDDLRIAVMIPPQALEKQPIDDLKKSILKSLSTQAAEMGHVLKVEDSYASECYFAYSKNTFINDVEQPQAFRKIQKCHGANNAFLSTIDDYVSTAMSNAHSASKTAPSPNPCYMTGIFWAVLHLLEKPDYKALSETEMAGLLQVPNLLGGLPVIYLHNFYVRAESDLLPPFLELLAFIKPRWPMIGSVMERFLWQLPAEARKSFSGLMADPYSLPIQKPQAVSTVLRQEVTRLLQNIVENEKVKQLFILSKSHFDERFLTVLFSADIWNVKLLSSCYNCGPGAIVAELIRKFESGRSIYNLLLIKRGRRVANRVLSKCLRMEKNLCDYRFQIIRRRITDSVKIDDYCSGEPCSWKKAQIIRETMWGRTISGVSQPCVQHQITIGDQDEFPASAEVGSTHFKVTYDTPEPHMDAPLFSVGKYTPFVGAVTGSGLGKPEARIPIENVFTPKVRTLMQLYQWAHTTKYVDGDVVMSNFPLVVKQLLEAYTKSTVAHLLPFVGQTVYGRTVQHHVRASNYRESIVPNTLLNLYTRVQHSAHSHGELSASAQHFLINFLHVQCMITSSIGYRMWVGQPSTRSTAIWAITSNCDKCMQPIHEEAMILSDTVLPPLDIGDDFTIGEKAVAEIARAVEEFRPSEYYVADDSSIQAKEAETCLIQHAMNRAWHRHTLARETTQHVLTERGEYALTAYGGRSMSREEQESYGLVHLDNILTDLAFKIYGEVIKRYYGEPGTEVQVSIANTPPSELPWTCVLQELDNHRRFNKFQQMARKVLGMTKATVLDRPESFSAMFGQRCYEIHSVRWKGNLTIANMSVAADPRVLQNIVERVHTLRFSYIDKTLGGGFHNVQDQASNPLVQALLALSFIDPHELVFGTSELNTDRIVMPLFPQLEDICEVLETYEVIPVETTDEFGGVVWTMDVVLPPFTAMVCRRYGITIETAQAIYVLYNESPLLYMERHADGVDLLSADVQVTIVRSNEATCLSKLRAARSGEGFSPLVRVHAQTSHLTPIKTRAEVYNVRPFRRDQTSQYVPPELDLPTSLPSQPFSLELNERCLYRPIGAGNISMSKAGYVLHHIGIKGLPPNCNVACLGDGYGGFTAVFAALGDGTTTVVYNTMPARPDSQPEPIIAKEVSETTKCKINDECIRMDYTDLTKRTTCEFLEQVTGNFHFITLDAEMPTNRSTSSPAQKERDVARQTMLLNVVTLFVRRGEPMAVLIMKVYIQEMLLWLPSIALLVPHCARCLLIRCCASASDGEVFIIAQLSHGQNIQYGLSPTYPPIRCIMSTLKFAEVYLTTCANDPRRKSSIKCKPDYPAVVRSLIGHLPLYGWAKLEEVCKLLVPDDIKRCTTTSIQQWIMAVDTFLSDISCAYCMELGGFISDIDADCYKTLTHSVIVSYRFITLRAFLLVAHLYQRSTAPILTSDAVRQGFLTCMAEMPAAFRCPEEIDPYLANNGRMKVHGIEFLPLPYWLQGIRWAMAAFPASLVGGIDATDDFEHQPHEL
ncbi:Ambylomma dissimile mivirus RNA dependent RNA polymerase [Amblyomma dissimile mivirus]|nr:Ambylomma dissimile mivirus RNA dependent RNA polymerase [Amblyomma dissimile mivirus]